MIETIRRLRLVSLSMLVLAIAALLPPLLQYALEPTHFVARATLDLAWIIGGIGFHMLLAERVLKLPRTRDKWIAGAALFALLLAAQVALGGLAISALPALTVGITFCVIAAGLIFGVSLFTLWMLLAVFTAESDFITDGVGQLLDALD